MRYPTAAALYSLLLLFNTLQASARHSVHHHDDQQRDVSQDGLSSSIVIASSTSTGASRALPTLHDENGSKSVHTVQPRFKNRWLRKRAGVICGLLGILCDYSSDVNNCGIKGNKCPTNWANGSGAICKAGVCGAATCATAYDFSWKLGKCVQTQNDEFNCGKAENVCSVPYATVQKCVSGVCKAGKCQNGFEEVDGQCLKIVDLSSDVNNCGKRGVVCPNTWDNGVGSLCNNGVCKPRTCNPGYGFDFAKAQCRDIYGDVNNCGAIGTVCSFPRGKGMCAMGVCTLTSCNDGYYNVNGVCMALSLDSDVANCGAVGATCVFNNGQGQCQKGRCRYTSCNAPYALIDNACVAVDLNNDANNCGSIGFRCQSTYVNGGAGICLAGKCTTTCVEGFSWDSEYMYCRQTSSDINNCGGVGNTCNPCNSLAAICSNGLCFATVCAYGYKLAAGQCIKIDTTSDVNNCGAIGRQCTFAPSGATGVCANAQCRVTNCPKGYAVSANGICIGATVSQRARVKKSKVVKQTLCPTGEVACPIADSASFEMAVTHHFSAPFNEYSGVMAGAGGYECLDIQSSLESCGGCASTGEGEDCSAIPHALGVGCEAGTCHVFSCAPGYRPSISSRSCIPVRSGYQGYDNSASPNKSFSAAYPSESIDETADLTEPSTSLSHQNDDDEALHVALAKSRLSSSTSPLTKSTRRQKRAILEAAESQLELEAGSPSSFLSVGATTKTTTNKKKKKSSSSSSQSRKRGKQSHLRALHNPPQHGQGGHKI
ncbi:hypothetical protein OIV83_003681 [Microbotryomycetes sp. JL201]|nr:hypothetical protein OIV83_003681 [Microbotryomycetes sp. JL201]